MDVTQALSVINGRPLRGDNKRRKTLDGSHSPLTTRPVSPELFELLQQEQEQRQAATPTGKFCNPFSLFVPLPLPVSTDESVTVEDMKQVVRMQLEQENCMELPDFIENCKSRACEDDENLQQTDDVPTLQRLHLYYKKNGVPREVEIKRRLMELFIFSDHRLKTPMGLIVPANDTDTTVYLWCLLYASLFCCNPLCHQALPFKDTHNSNLKELVFYQLECGHACRFCPDCAEKDTVTCPMCNTTGTPKLCCVYQRVGGKANFHVNCFNEPCSCCRNFNP